MILATDADVDGPISNFQMGKNTPEGKDRIMDSLVVLVEE